MERHNLPINFTFVDIFYTLVRKQENSIYWPYLETLPKNFDTVLRNWPEKYDPFLMRHVKADREKKNKYMDLSYDQITKSLNQENSQNITKDEFLYGSMVAGTRSIELEIELDYPSWFNRKLNIILAPVFDFINHSSSSGFSRENACPILPRKPGRQP